MADETKAPAGVEKPLTRHTLYENGDTRRDPEGIWAFWDEAQAKIDYLRAALARAEAENARAAEEGFKIAARLTARVEEADARAARAEGERENLQRRIDGAEAGIIGKVTARMNWVDMTTAEELVVFLEEWLAVHRGSLRYATARAEKYREAGKQFAEEIEHGCLACCGDGCEGAHVDDTREAIDTFRRALGGGA
jgi:hypothetical protein